MAAAYKQKGGNIKGLFVKNTIFSVTQQTITTVTTFLLLPYMIWRMGDEGYGFWMLLQIFSIGGYLSLADMGFQGSIIRYLTKFLTEHDTEEFRKLYVSGMLLFLVLGAVCCIGLLLFNKYFFLSLFSIPPDRTRELQAGLAVYSLSFIFQFPAMILKAFYSSTQDFFRLKLWETLNVLIFAILVVAIMFFKTSVFVVVLSETIVHVIFFAVFLIVPVKYYRELYTLNINYFSVKSLKNVSSMTSYLFIYRIFGLIYNRTPQIFIAYFLSPAFMTYYAVISKIPRTLKLLQGVTNSAVLPLAVSLDTLQHKDKMKQLFLRGTRYSFVFLTPVVLFTLVFAEDILALWIGVDYQFLADYLKVYVIWQYMNFLTSFGSSMFTKTEHFKQLTPYYIVGTGLLLACMIFFMERLDLWAVLLGFLLSSCIVLPSNMMILQRINKFSFHEFYSYVLRFPVILGVLMCIILLFLIKIYVPADSIITLISFAVIMYLLYMVIFYKFCLFDFEKNDIALLLKKR